jgi:flagellar hook-basal body complex protein FliE
VIPAISGAVGPLGPSEWNVGSIGGLGADATSATGATAAGAAGSGGSFSGTLTGAINSLEQTQNTASATAQQLATGQLSDPTQAITAVENASMAMDLASQISTKLVTAVNQMYQTQV